ncbi:hypothetical protein [Roseateles saccharophilus]|jgi:hypothetical protein|uniref:hypothetical protein n=1 Tax=Roseateles saccharophilus TaxID=304 RepID=UPI00104F4D63|nr:hypothetical protein [Roseateles saccharophilus]MBL8277977.1 hypothetical protein [Roseateles sp.]MDG0833139.1 hypothetical protein [Roseateles saccharophilus]
MSKLLRIVLTWVLAVALPLQGYAVHAMTACGPAHNQGKAAAAQSSAQHLDKAAADHGRHGHDHVSSTDGAHAEVAKSGTAGHADKCSACASCCHLTAMASTAVHFDVIPSRPVGVATTPTAHDRVLLGRLDRPPRSLHA